MGKRVVSRRGDPIEVDRSDDPEPPKPLDPPVFPMPLDPPIGTLRVDGTIDLDFAEGLDAAIMGTGPNDVVLLRADHPISEDDHRVVEQVAQTFDRTVMLEEEADA